MIKPLLSGFTGFVLILIALSTSGVFAQSKGGKSKKSGSEDKGVQSAPLLMPAPESNSSEGFAGKMPSEYRYVVLINPSDEDAVRLWAHLPTVIDGVSYDVLDGVSNAYAVVSKNPQLALFKQAYGSHFQIFSEQDLVLFGASIPCLQELVPKFNSLSKRLISK